MLSSDDDSDFQPPSTTSRRFKAARRTKTPVSARSCKKPKQSSVLNEPTAARQLGRAPSKSSIAPAPAPGPVVATSASLDAATEQVSNNIIHEGRVAGFLAPPPDGLLARTTNDVHDQEQDTSCSCCPVCGVTLSSVSDTAAGQAVHVNACLDATATPAAVARPPSPTLIEDITPEQDDTAWTEEVDAIQKWLSNIGAAEVASAFLDADIDLSVLPHLNDNDLQELGIASVEVRSRILQEAADMQQPMSGVSSSLAQQHQGQAAVTQQQHQQQQLVPPGPDICDAAWPTDWLHSQDCGEEDWDIAAAELQSQQRQPGSQQQDCELQGNWQQQQNCELQGNWQQQPECELQGNCHQQQQQQRQLQQQGGLCEQGWLGTDASLCEQPQRAGDPDQQGSIQQQNHQQQQQQRGPLQWQPGPLHSQGANQQQPWPAAPDRLDNSSSGVGQILQQTSISGFVLRQPRQQQQEQQQQQDVKEQWRALFKRPKQPLGAHNPAQAGQLLQARINRQGQVVPAAPQPAEPPPLPALPQARGASLPSWWPAWRRLPGTNIIVDCFGRSCAAVGSNHTWILTHFHADHYMGLTRGFKQGVIICTPITAALVRLKLRVAPERLAMLELGQELNVEGTRLQLIDANHCPGAAMVVAHTPGAPPVLHTGDARLSPEATRHQPILQDLVGRAVLVLDTTYADPAYCFPPQQEVLDWVLRAVKAELFNPRCLFLFGTYTIGKERLFLHVASALQRKVYVAAAKRSIMGCLNLPPQLSALLTTNHMDANIHAVPMRQVTLEAMESLLLRYKGRYTAVVGFKPTGWSHAGGAGRAGQVGPAAAAAAPSQPSRSSLSIKPNRRRSQRGTVVLYQVPYSEHSSCAELCSFVEWFRPLRIIPSVNNDNGPKLRAMMAAVTASSSTTGPMDAFARRQR